MSPQQPQSAYVDEAGRLVLPPEVAARHGLRPGAQVQLVDDPTGIVVRRPATHLAKVYVEPTSGCNREAGRITATEECSATKVSHSAGNVN